MQKNGFGKASDHKTRVIAVTSGKGGVGKTNISVNLAIAFAQTGKRVILIDGDLGMANVNVLLGITPKAEERSLLKDKWFPFKIICFTFFVLPLPG